MTAQERVSLDTAAVHAGEPDPKTYGSAGMPIFQCSVFAYRGDEDGPLRYPRYSNTPNHEALGAKLAALEGGEDAIVASSGMAAISGALLASLGTGGHLLIQRGAYGGTSAFVLERLATLGFQHDFVDATAPETWSRLLRPNTRAFYVEAMSNPCVDVPDLGAVVAFAREHGIVSLIDNTLASPVLFQAARFGFDLSLHSATKYLNGHDDVVAGCAIGRKHLVAEVRQVLKMFGGALDPHACWLVHRGVKTIALRVPRQCESALVLARFLERHPAVSSVRYPGLESSPHHARASKYFRGGFGCVLAFDPKGGAEAAKRILDRVKLPIVGPSLGGVETLMSMPVLVSHRDVPRAEREAAGITESLVRVSVGIEAVDDLVADFDSALKS